MLVQNTGYYLSQVNIYPCASSRNIAFKGASEAIVDEKVKNFSNDLITLLNEKANIGCKDIVELIKKQK